ncbi:MAG: hypothetical protein US49_C0021G0002 [candidate division TM6 bacterium GW2011_GWF2_37_49]|nr:MAG: hypothetical protein US49_C0021G0002 [candidate division TM6 bacterium GW2011_GWF2_37_49]
MLTIKVKVLTNTKEESIEQLSSGEYKIKTRSKPISGDANCSIIRIISKHFKVKERDISIKIGQRSNSKIVQIEDGIEK